MPHRTFLAAAALLVAAHAAAADVRMKGAGALLPPAPGPVATGEFRLSAKSRGSRPETARVDVSAEDLDVTRNAAGKLPEHRVVLVAADGTEADVGAMRVRQQGTARLRNHRAAASLPASAPTLRAFEGGTLHVRREGVTVLSATVPRLAVAGAGTSLSRLRVFGDFEAVDKPRRSPGTYRLQTEVDEDGVRRNTVLVVSPRLPTDPNSAGVRPDYRVFLLAPNGGRTVDLGSMDLELRYGAGLGLDSADGALPGITDLREFGDGRIEVRRSGTVLLRGFVVPFPEMDDAPLPQRDVASSGDEELSPPDLAQTARARIHARLDVFPARRQQRVVVEGVALAAGSYDVVAVHASGTRTSLGSFAPPGALRIDTSHGDDLPGGRLTWLSGQSVEVLGAGGVLVLSGAFPTIR